MNELLGGGLNLSLCKILFVEIKQAFSLHRVGTFLHISHMG